MLVKFYAIEHSMNTKLVVIIVKCPFEESGVSIDMT